MGLAEMSQFEEGSRLKTWDMFHFVNKQGGGLIMIVEAEPFVSLHLPKIKVESIFASNVQCETDNDRLGSRTIPV